MSKTSKLSTGNAKYSTIYYSIAKTVSTASESLTSDEEEITLIAKSELNYKYNPVRAARIKRINALRNSPK